MTAFECMLLMTDSEKDISTTRELPSLRQRRCADSTDDIPELPDKDQLVMVYCRSGRRSKEAAGKLVKLGYTNIVEFGGILDWKGEIVTSE